MSDNRLYLEHILERIDLIDEFIHGDQSIFLESKMAQEAVLRCLEIIGEAARNLSDDLRARYTDVPWRQIMATRNILIHDYGGVRLDIAWQIIERDLPALKTQVTKILAELDALKDNAD